MVYNHLCFRSVLTLLMLISVICVHSEIHVLILFCMKNCLNSDRSESLQLFKESIIKHTAVTSEAYHLYQFHPRSYVILFIKVNSTCTQNYCKIINADFSVTDQLLTTYSLLITYLNENWNKMGQCISYL